MYVLDFTIYLSIQLHFQTIFNYCIYTIYVFAVDSCVYVFFAVPCAGHLLRILLPSVSTFSSASTSLSQQCKLFLAIPHVCWVTS